MSIIFEEGPFILYFAENKAFFGGKFAQKAENNEKIFGKNKKNAKIVRKNQNYMLY